MYVEIQFIQIQIRVCLYHIKKIYTTQLYTYVFNFYTIFNTKKYMHRDKNAVASIARKCYFVEIAKNLVRVCVCATLQFNFSAITLREMCYF